MRFVDDQYLQLSRSGRTSPGLQARMARASERVAHELDAIRARPPDPAEPLVIRIPVTRPIHLVPRTRTQPRLGRAERNS